MSRLIDADALIDDCKKYLNKLNPSRDGKECTRIHWLIGVLSNAPTIEPERKKGKWLVNGDIPKDCPFCGEDWDKYVFGDVWYTGELPKFCPNCGVDMRGEEDE